MSDTNRRSSGSHFLSLWHYNRLQSRITRGSWDSFSSDPETIRSLPSSPNRSQIPSQTDNSEENQETRLEPTQQPTASPTVTNPPSPPSSSSPSSPGSVLKISDIEDAVSVPPFLYHFDEISYAIRDPLSERLSSSSWICTLRGDEVIVFRRKYNGEITRSSALAIFRSRHRSLAGILGASLRGDRIFIVYEYVAGSSLKQCLNLTSFSMWMSRMQVAHDVAMGLEYIHRHCDTVHDKIRSSNIIVTKTSFSTVMKPSFNAKIGLCGASDLAVSDEISMIPTQNDVERGVEQLDGRWLRIEGATGHIAPEVLAGGRVSKKSDVFAFGVVILELIFGRAPLEYLVNKETLECEKISVIETAKYAVGTDSDESEVEERGGRMRLSVDPQLQDSFPVEAAEELIRLGLRCVEADPSTRPDTVFVAGTISKLLLVSKAWEERFVGLSQSPSRAEGEGDISLNLHTNKYVDCAVFPQAEGDVAMVLDLTSQDSSTSSLKSFTVGKSVEFSYEELARATNDFSITNRVGEGAFGDVYYGELRGEKAAIKKMDMQASQEFLTELKVLTRVNHLNLVRLIGYCLDSSLFLVYEFIDNWDLNQHLRGSDMDPLQWSTRVKVALDSARGLEYIHEHTVPIYIHRNITPVNILLDKQFHAKVKGFGLSIHTEAGGHELLVGTFGYMPPEYMVFGDVSPKVDVYAFGVVLYELISAKEAIVKGSGPESRGLVSLFEDALSQPDPKEHLKKLVDPRLGNNYPIDSVHKMALLAKACTEENSQLRPSMQTVVVALTMLSSSTEDWNVGFFFKNQANNGWSHVWKIKGHPCNLSM